HLFGKYNKHIRPALHHQEVTNVSLEFALFSILSLDTRAQTLFLNGELIMQWHDHYLTWDPDLYNGTRVIRVPYHEIWYPDVILYNTADPNYGKSVLRTNAIVRNTGQVRLLSHAMFLSSCDVDITWYPFDQQDCTLFLASWTYDSSKIELFNEPSDLSEYSENPEFIIENLHNEKSLHSDPCCALPFSSLLVFLLPPDSGEKVGLSMNCLLAMMVFLTAVTMGIPSSETVPLIGHFYLACILTVALNLIMSVCTLRCRFSDSLNCSGKVSGLYVGSVETVTVLKFRKRQAFSLICWLKYSLEYFYKP
ncbi:neuronal acetylcholine receptor subunit alpha-9-like, partial [Penaeus japonicus]|uniref:neuronal acetylcholine receptor subunit alpha-9-like n=1 Tax=Penaeus japonicus TaxID=27405 RepID=UPI001C7171CF